jgi:hypothetical protein
MSDKLNNPASDDKLKEIREKLDNVRNGSLHKSLWSSSATEDVDYLLSLVEELKGQVLTTKTDAASWKRHWQMYRDAWVRELGGWIVPNAHEIDSLVLTTRKRCVNPLLGNCSTPHWLGKPTEDRKALQQTPHPLISSCKDWKFTDTNSISPQYIIEVVEVKPDQAPDKHSVRLNGREIVAFDYGHEAQAVAGNLRMALAPNSYVSASTPERGVCPHCGADRSGPSAEAHSDDCPEAVRLSGPWSKERAAECIIAICGTFVPGGWAHPGDECVRLIEETIAHVSAPQTSAEPPELSDRAKVALYPEMRDELKRLRSENSSLRAYRLNAEFDAQLAAPQPVSVGAPKVEELLDELIVLADWSNTAAPASKRIERLTQLKTELLAYFTPASTARTDGLEQDRQKNTVHSMAWAVYQVFGALYSINGPARITNWFWDVAHGEDRDVAELFPITPEERAKYEWHETAAPGSVPQAPDNHSDLFFGNLQYSLQTLFAKVGNPFKDLAEWRAVWEALASARKHFCVPQAEPPKKENL